MIRGTDQVNEKEFSFCEYKIIDNGYVEGTELYTDLSNDDKTKHRINQLVKIDAAKLKTELPSLASIRTSEN